MKSSSVSCPHVQDLRLKGQRAAWVTAKTRAAAGLFLLQYSIPPCGYLPLLHTPSECPYVLGPLLWILGVLAVS